MSKQQNISQAHRRRSGGGALGAESRLTRLLHLAADFNAVLDKCSLSAEAEEVHRTRTGSRRIQAIVETMLREGGVRAIPLKQAAQPWLRQLKRLRRKAGSVRDLDVHRKLLKKPLEEWIEESAAAEGEERAAADGGVERKVAESGIAESGAAISAAIPETGRLRNQAARLDAWLKHERQLRVEALKKYLEKHRQKLAVHEIAFLAAADRRRAPSGKAPRRAVLVALDDFARLAHAMPMLEANNLHEFRKSVKKARYVAEVGGDDRSSQTVAEALKRLQDAIGVWHDWLCLTQEARTALGSDGGELTAWLAIETGGHFTQALAIAERLRGELLGEWMAASNQPREWQAVAGTPGKRPSRAGVGALANKSRVS